MDSAVAIGNAFLGQRAHPGRANLMKAIAGLVLNATSAILGGVPKVKPPLAALPQSVREVTMRGDD